MLSIFTLVLHYLFIYIPVCASISYNLLSFAFSIFFIPKNLSIFASSVSIHPSESLPKAKLLATLGHTLSDASNSAESVTKDFNPDEMIEDSFGYPLFFGVLGPGANRIAAKYSENFKISDDFTLCYHINFVGGKFIKVFQITDYLKVSYHESGYLRIRFR